jgi:hypothetical protein
MGERGANVEEKCEQANMAAASFSQEYLLHRKRKALGGSLLGAKGLHGWGEKEQSFIAIRDRLVTVGWFTASRFEIVLEER